ncbi:uncharacterized protein K444DRAFT_596419 [Hyaloscypha bicolor E]|uniref:Phospholipid/glycerol acyltransferase domain-containing protein n=1 Tax=Hyaloscypha bicolor E TaxID=1095630 RepID=A0A2J6SXM4_9HELO|nr:uncharacterized protein K444DRAFT_596419 [Hyaloscypha bicolor E]PMD55514.1 hypothetical protein K444DRAFT_596419 [Hyaloscypha bicolor E]
MTILQKSTRQVGIYHVTIWVLSTLLHIFYKEISISNLHNVQTVGPILFVAAPHSNDMIDPAMISSVLLFHLHHPVSFLAAERVMRRRFISMIATAMGCITLRRVWDRANLGRGRIFAPDITNEPQLIKGRGTRFDQDAKVGDFVMIVVAKQRILRAEISEIRGPQELYLKEGFTGLDNPKEVLTDSLYSLARKPESDNAFPSIFAKFKEGGAICMFPEGTTHDQSDLLPLKTGFAVIALSYLAANPHSTLNLVPCGIHHTNGHRFRSRAAVEFRAPIYVPKSLVERYRNGEEKGAVRELTEIVYQNLKEVTFKYPDSRVLDLAQALRRIYEPNSGLYPMDQKASLNKKMLKLLSDPQQDSRVKSLLRSANEYDLQLRDQGIQHHQIRYARLSWKHSLVLLFFQLGKLLLISPAIFPGLLLFTPVLILANSISKKKAKLAVATSPFKIQGLDVVASWKTLTAMAVTPFLYSFYTALLTYWAIQNQFCGVLPKDIRVGIVAAVGFILLSVITFVSFLTGDYAVATLKSLRPLLMLQRRRSSKQMRDMYNKQSVLQREVRVLIDLPSCE